jgi:hypothetical protein
LLELLALTHRDDELNNIRKSKKGQIVISRREKQMPRAQWKSKSSAKNPVLPRMAPSREDFKPKENGRKKEQTHETAASCSNIVVHLQDRSVGSDCPTPVSRLLGMDLGVNVVKPIRGIFNRILLIAMSFPRALLLDLEKSLCRVRRVLKHKLALPLIE